MLYLSVGFRFTVSGLPSKVLSREARVGPCSVLTQPERVGSESALRSYRRVVGECS
jgi:hypothetical protein